MPMRHPKISLQFVKNIVVQFCPWEPNVRSTRNFLSHVSSVAARESNLNCKVQAVVKNDGSPPQITVDYLDGKRLVFKSTNLTAVEMLQKFNKWHKTRLAAPEADTKEGETKEEATKEGAKR